MRTTAIAIASLILAASANGQDKAPTFSKDVAPILFQQCATCHRPGEAAPFPLLTYQDAKKRGKLIAHVTQSRLMPPWKADKGDVAFRNERRLKDADIAVLQQWLAAGMPEGDKKDLPAQPSFVGGWPLGKPDLVVKMPKAYHVPAEGRDIYRSFAIALDLKEDKWVKAIDFRPSAASVVHHTLFFLDATGTAAKQEAASGEVGSRGGMGGARTGAKDKKGGLGGLGGIIGGLGGEGGIQASAPSGLGGWALGAQARSLPDGLAYRLPKGVAEPVLPTSPSGRQSSHGRHPTVAATASPTSYCVNDFTNRADPHSPSASPAVSTSRPARKTTPLRTPSSSPSTSKASASAPTPTTSARNSR